MRIQVNSRSEKSGERGFSLIELLIVLAVIMIVTAVAVPNIVTAMRDIRLREGAANYAGVVQRARLRAVQDNSYYPVAVGADGTGAQVAYVDLTQTGLGPYASGDPDSPISSEVTFPSSGAPNTTGLSNQVVPAGSITPVTTDPANGPWIHFGPRGLPCTVSGSVCVLTTGTPAVPVAYITYLQSSTSQKWDAVSVTPAGRVQVWGYDGTNWNRLN